MPTAKGKGRSRCYHECTHLEHGYGLARPLRLGLVQQEREIEGSQSELKNASGIHHAPHARLEQQRRVLALRRRV